MRPRDAHRAGRHQQARLGAARGGQPRIEPAANKSAPDSALEFSAVFEVYPEVTVGDVATATIERPQVEVTPADIDRTLEVLRKQRATFAPAAGRETKSEASIPVRREYAAAISRTIASCEEVSIRATAQPPNPQTLVVCRE